MKAILVTGGAGFIGSNFISHMLNRYQDYKIINLDKLTYAGNLNNLKEIENDDRYLFIQGDISDIRLVSELFQKHSITYVVNFAAESHVDRSIEGPEVFLKSNIIGTHTLLQAALENWKIHEKKSSREFKSGVKFIQISTDEVYGTLGETGSFSENTPLMPNSPYSASKAAADHFVRAYGETFGLPYNITRCSNNYGPKQFPEKMIPVIIKNILKNEKIPVYGDGLQIRDWLHVNDHCEAIDLVLHNGTPGEIYNIGGNNEIKNIDLVKLIINEMGASNSLIEYVEDRPGHDRRYAINTLKIFSELGWKPKVNFSEGIKNTIEWYKKVINIKD